MSFSGHMVKLWISWNIPQQQTGMTSWPRRHFRWISRGLCWAEKAISDDILTCCVIPLRKHSWNDKTRWRTDQALLGDEGGWTYGGAYTDLHTWWNYMDRPPQVSTYKTWENWMKLVGCISVDFLAGYFTAVMPEVSPKGTRDLYYFLQLHVNLQLSQNEKLKKKPNLDGWSSETRPTVKGQVVLISHRLFRTYIGPLGGSVG